MKPLSTTELLTLAEWQRRTKARGDAYLRVETVFPSKDPLDTAHRRTMYRLADEGRLHTETTVPGIPCIKAGHPVVVRQAVAAAVRALVLVVAIGVSLAAGG